MLLNTAQVLSFATALSSVSVLALNIGLPGLGQNLPTVTLTLPQVVSITICVHVKLDRQKLTIITDYNSSTSHCHPSSTYSNYYYPRRSYHK